MWRTLFNCACGLEDRVASSCVSSHATNISVCANTQGSVPRMCVVAPLFGIALLSFELQKDYMYVRVSVLYVCCVSYVRRGGGNLGIKAGGRLCLADIPLFAPLSFHFQD